MDIDFVYQLYIYTYLAYILAYIYKLQANRDITTSPIIRAMQACVYRSTMVCNTHKRIKQMYIHRDNHALSVGLYSGCIQNQDVKNEHPITALSSHQFIFSLLNIGSYVFQFSRKALNSIQVDRPCVYLCIYQCAMPAIR